MTARRARRPLGAEEARYDLVEYGVTLGPAIRALPARQRVILRLRFQEDMTQSEIAQLLGISQMHVSRLLRQALGRLRAVARARHAGALSPGWADAPAGRAGAPMMGAMGTPDSGEPPDQRERGQARSQERGETTRARSAPRAPIPARTGAC